MRRIFCEREKAVNLSFRCGMGAMDSLYRKTEAVKGRGDEKLKVES